MEQSDFLLHEPEEEESLVLPSEPYRGIKSFRYIDRNIFAAREWEKDQLLSLICRYRGSLLYGQSGVGKSSLINAGLIPKFQKHNFQAEVIRISPTREGTFIIYRTEISETEHRFLPSLFSKNSDNNPQLIVSFEAFKDIISKQKYLKETDNKNNQLPIPVLIFDQFEELITYFEEVGNRVLSEKELTLSERKDFQLELINFFKECYYNPELRVKFLFVFREDYLAKFSKLLRAIPDLRDHTLRVKAISKNDIKDIINCPFSKPKSKDVYTNALTDDQRQTLTEELKIYFGEDEATLTDIQIACSYLYNNPEKEERQGLLAAENPINNLIEQWYLNELKTFSSQDQLIAVDILSLLVLNDKTRNIFHGDAIVEELQSRHTPEEIIEVRRKLDDDTKLVRSEWRKGGKYYEINSESLIPFINKQKITKANIEEQKKQEILLADKEKENQRLLNEKEIERLQKEKAEQEKVLLENKILTQFLMQEKEKERAKNEILLAHQKAEQEELKRVAIEKENESKIRRRNILRNALIAIVVISVCFAVIVSKQSSTIKNRNAEITNRNTELTNTGVLYKANQYVQEGDVRKAFRIYGYLDSIGDNNIKKQIKKIKLDYTDLPGKEIIVMANNYVRCLINDSTYELWKIISSDSIYLQRTFTNIQLKAANHKYLAIYSNSQLLLFNTYTGKTDTLNKQLTDEPYFGFSVYTDYFIYTVNNNLYTVDLKNANHLQHFIIDPNLKKAFRDIISIKENQIFSYYNDYLVLWKTNDKDSLVMDENRSKDAYGSTWFPLHGDSILLVSDNGLKAVDIDSNKTRIVKKENFSSYKDSYKASDSLLFLYTETDIGSGVYTAFAFYDLQKKIFRSAEKGKFTKLAISKDYVKCLIRDATSGKVYLFDNTGKQGKQYLLYSENWLAYDISDDGNYILYVLKDKTGKLEKKSSHLYLYNLGNSSVIKIDAINEKQGTKSDSTSIYGTYYFRFSSTSDKIAYIGPSVNDSAYFIVKDINNKNSLYRSAKITKIMDDGNKTDFTKDYIHVYTSDNKEGIVLLNGQPRTPSYYSKFYPKLSAEEWNKLVKELDLDL